MRLTERSCWGVRLSPPNLAVAASRSSAAHGVADRLRLLEDFLEHVMLISAQVHSAGFDLEHVNAGAYVTMVAVDHAQTDRP